MPAYLIVMRNEPIRDAEAMAEYQRQLRETRSPIATQPLVIYGEMQALEGETPDGMVMLRFESVEDARAWYESPGYQAALPHRLKAADHRSFIVEGL